jgi:hypothetical protein
MKLSDIFEAGQRPTRHPYTVELERQYQDPAGEWQTEMVEVSGVVFITTDAFSTGDSPTDYDVELHSAVSTTARKPISINQLSRSDIEWVKEKAVSTINRNR